MNLENFDKYEKQIYNLQKPWESKNLSVKFRHFLKNNINHIDH